MIFIFINFYKFDISIDIHNNYNRMCMRKKTTRLTILISIHILHHYLVNKIRIVS